MGRKYPLFHSLWADFLMVALLQCCPLVLAQDSTCPNCNKPVPPSATKDAEEYCPDCKIYFNDQENQLRESLISLVRETVERDEFAKEETLKDILTQVAGDWEKYGKKGLQLTEHQKKPIHSDRLNIRILNRVSNEAFSGVTAGRVRPLILESEAEALIRLLIPLLNSLGHQGVTVARLIPAVFFGRIWSMMCFPRPVFFEQDGYKSFLAASMGTFLVVLNEKSNEPSESKEKRLLDTLMSVIKEAGEMDNSIGNQGAFQPGSIAENICDSSTAQHSLRHRVQKCFGHAGIVNISEFTLTDQIQTLIEGSQQEVMFTIQGLTTPSSENDVMVIKHSASGHENIYHIFLFNALTGITVNESQLPAFSEQLTIALQSWRELYSRILFPEKRLVFDDAVALFGIFPWPLLIYQLERLLWTGKYSIPALLLNGGVLMSWLILMHRNLRQSKR